MSSSDECIRSLENTIGPFLTAIYCTKRKIYNSAVHLFEKSGRIKTATDICVAQKYYDKLVELATEMDEDLFRTVEEYLILVKEYRKAFDLNLRVGNSSQAVELCLKYKLSLSEDTYDQLVAVSPSQAKDVVFKMSNYFSSLDPPSPLAKKYPELREIAQMEFDEEKRREEEQRRQEEEQQRMLEEEKKRVLEEAQESKKKRQKTHAEESAATSSQVEQTEPSNDTSNSPTVESVVSSVDEAEEKGKGVDRNIESEDFFDRSL